MSFDAIRMVNPFTQVAENTALLGATERRDHNPSVCGERPRLGRLFLPSIAVATIMPIAALAQIDSDEPIDEIIALGDPVGLTDDNSTDSVFGTNRSLKDTPRSISIVSDTTMERYP